MRSIPSKYQRLLATACALLLGAGPAARGWTLDPAPARPARMNAETGNAAHARPNASVADAPVLKPGEWEAFVDPEDQIFPSLLLASATVQTPPLRDPAPSQDGGENSADEGKKKKRAPAAKAAAKKPAADPDVPEVLGDQSGLIGVTIVSPADGAHARVEVRENALLGTSVLDADLPTKGKTYHLLPKIDYKYDALNRVRQSYPINIALSVELDGKSMGQQFVTARVHPINDCPYAYQNPDDAKDYVDIAWMFAAYVNEDHPAIPGLLKEAQDTGVVDAFDAYQSEDPGRVLLQVFAVWEALRSHDIKYSDIGTTTTESDSLYTLHVRFIEETLAESHANCVDASVLLASILRRMGIDTFLVLEPGHMFLGIYLDRDGKETACLETTMLDDSDPAKCLENKALARAATREVRQLKGWRCFNEALDSGTKEYRKHRRRFLKENDPEYEIVDIASARWEGIAPIGYVQPDGSVTSPPEAPKNQTHVTTGATASGL